jgi:ATP-dependent helicase YprA (DUF1998 family)
VFCSSRNSSWTEFQRLRSRRGEHGGAPPTLITTGTGSGKTEAFLIPILDHCRRERSAGRQGIKAVLLYPMNDLATDQALRLNGLLSKEPLAAGACGTARLMRVILEC